ncbi:uncharacterized protein DEA37_0012712 [Paragonimus westermani]|uniref:Uncharacterized protein n=1 Tax=Paragonimus westermani TaxID=34504 RepID=A0A5J4NP82_9TREM|nr:uncharacterized protein DEA37_0012712 [Paragonimus westermani]
MVTSFKDLGKSTRELFDKHFKFGLLNFEFKTKTSNDITVTCGGKHDSKSQNVEGYLESKLKPTKGVSLKTKVDSAWIITSELEVEKKLHKGLSHDVIATVETESGIPQFKQVVLGVQAVVDTEPFKLKKHVYALGFKHDNLRAHASLTDHSNIDINVYQEQRDVELGFKVGWNKETRETSFGAVVQYQPSSKSKFKVKVDQNAVIGLSYRLKLDSVDHSACLAGGTSSVRMM